MHASISNLSQTHTPGSIICANFELTLICKLNRQRLRARARDWLCTHMRRTRKRAHMRRVARVANPSYRWHGFTCVCTRELKSIPIRWQHDGARACVCVHRVLSDQPCVCVCSCSHYREMYLVHIYTDTYPTCVCVRVCQNAFSFAELLAKVRCDKSAITLHGFGLASGRFCGAANYTVRRCCCGNWTTRVLAGASGRAARKRQHILFMFLQLFYVDWMDGNWNMATQRMRNYHDACSLLQTGHFSILVVTGFFWWWFVWQSIQYLLRVDFCLSITLYYIR